MKELLAIDEPANDEQHRKDDTDNQRARAHAPEICRWCVALDHFFGAPSLGFCFTPLGFAAALTGIVGAGSI
jgi:hypothetical protein